MFLVEVVVVFIAVFGFVQFGYVFSISVIIFFGEKGEVGILVVVGIIAVVIFRRYVFLEQLVRQGFFRGFSVFSQKNSFFKRQLSLRLNELLFTLQRRIDFQVKGIGEFQVQWKEYQDRYYCLLYVRDREEVVYIMIDQYCLLWVKEREVEYMVINQQYLLLVRNRREVV